MMPRVIDFSERAVATLRARVAAIEEDNRDLVAFARGHSGAAGAVHRAALAAIEAPTRVSLIGVVTREWPAILGLDAVAFAVREGRGAIHAQRSCYRLVEPRLIDRAIEPLPPVSLRDVPRGHPLFGPAAETIRAEALIRIAVGDVSGLLVLGQTAPQGFEGAAGAELLIFLGDVIGRMMARCPSD